ncbi:MAG: DUF3089 domain-containing protein [Chitinophagaceae bacterium]|nr:DUF3089 domain-containing protein [Chitinophagaceae bacterium]
MNQKICLLILLATLLITSCSNRLQKSTAGYSFSHPSGTPDYSNLDHWAAHPYKKDPSDSIPLPLRKGYQADSSVDVFFIHPTTYTDTQRLLGWNAPIDNTELNTKTDYTTILFQASIFNEAGRVFSPRYRQANLSSYFPVSANDTIQALAAFMVAYEDVKAAFTYYLQHHNNGHPIIIASHSQGTTHAKRLLKEFFEGTALQKQLVAAYLVGIPLEPDYFTAIKPCITPYQTGCACSWRTYKEGYKPDYVLKEKFTAIVTNPLTWDEGMPAADRKMNKGGLLLNFNKLLKNVTNAKVNEGVLWTEKPHFFGSLFLKTKNYHVADLNFFYLSIRENAKQRVSAFRKK